jgi:hypothetical protein
VERPLTVSTIEASDASEKSTFASLRYRRDHDLKDSPTKEGVKEHSEIEENLSH